MITIEKVKEINFRFTFKLTKLEYRLEWELGKGSERRSYDIVYWEVELNVKLDVNLALKENI